jgi:hypothetical protein
MPAVDTVRLSRAAVEAARRACLLTIGELAEAVPCGVTSLGRARSGQRVGLPLAKRIARALGADLRALLTDGPAVPRDAEQPERRQPDAAPDLAEPVGASDGRGFELEVEP